MVVRTSSFRQLELIIIALLPPLQHSVRRHVRPDAFEYRTRVSVTRAMGAKRTRDEDDAEEAFPRGASGAGGDDLPRGGGGSTGGSTAASKKRSKNRMFDDDDGGVRAH